MSRARALRISPSPTLTDPSRLSSPILSIIRGVLNIDEAQGLYEYFALTIVPSEGDPWTIDTVDTLIPVSQFISGGEDSYSFTAIAVSGSNRFESSLPSNTVIYTLIDEKLNRPTISIADGILTIVPNDDRTEGYLIDLTSAEGTERIETADSTVDLTAFSFSSSPITVTVISVSSGYFASEPSDALTYVVTLPAPLLSEAESVLTIVDESGLAEEFDIFVDGVWRDTVTPDVSYIVYVNDSGGETYDVTTQNYTTEINAAGGTTYTIGG